MAINVNALRRVDEAQNNGNKMFMAAKEIGDDTIVRLVPPKSELNGLFYFEQKVYWINKKPLVSPATFGEHCVIEEYLDNVAKDLEIAKAEGKPDEDLQALYDNAKARRSNFMIPLLHLSNIEYDADNKVVKYEVVTDGVRVLQCGPQLMNAINKVFLSPALLRRLQGVEDLIADRVKGYNIALSRKGKALDTKYEATADEQCEIDSKYYDKIPSCIQITKKQTYTDKYLKAVLDNYFYGDPAPNDNDRVSRYVEGKVEEPSNNETSRERPSASNGANVGESNRVSTRSKTDNSKEQSKPQSTSTNNTRSIVDDMNDLDDDDMDLPF